MPTILFSLEMVIERTHQQKPGGQLTREIYVRGGLPQMNGEIIIPKGVHGLYWMTKPADLERKTHMDGLSSWRSAAGKDRQRVHQKGRRGSHQFSRPRSPPNCGIQRRENRIFRSLKTKKKGMTPDDRIFREESTHSARHRSSRKHRQRLEGGGRVCIQKKGSEEQ